VNKTIALLLALAVSASTIAQSTAPSTSYTKMNGNKTKFTSYHENGKIKEIGYFLNENKDGVWEHYNESGVKTSEANFTNGVKDGNWSIWNESGVLTYLMVYEDGKRILTTQWDEAGKLIAGMQTK
jgi:antitoxin component YwqK of YwqJK toxin-antitoxin module